MTTTPGPEWREQQRSVPEGPLPYGTDPMSAPAGPPGIGVAPPPEVQMAFWLWIASFVLALLAAGIIYFGTIGDLTGAAYLTARNRPLTFPGVDSQNLIRYIIFIGLLLFFAFKVRAGKNWARITLTTLTALLGVLGLPSVIRIAVGADALFILYVVLSSLQAALVVAAIVFVFLPNAKYYFRSAPRHR